MSLDISTIRTPSAADAEGRKAKFTLSAAARDRLRRASELSGQTMSNLIEMLIMQELVLPGEHDDVPAPNRTVSKPPEEIDNRLGIKPAEEDEDFDFDR